MKKYKYKVTDLDCANCAKAVEDHLNNTDGINNCILNYNKLTLELETDLNGNVKKQIEKIAKEVESDIRILELNEDIETSKKVKKQLTRIIIGTIFGIIGLLISNRIVSLTVIALGYLILLSNCIKKAIQLFISKKTINENLLITISCFGAFAIGALHEGLMVVILYEIGKLLELFAVDNSRKSIADLMDIKPEYANLKTSDGEIKVKSENVNINDIIIVKKGEKVSLDGVIIKGETKLNTSALTGESKLQIANENDEVISGSINEGDIIEIRVTKDYENSTVSKILDLVENATNRKTKTETFVSRAAKVYTPIVIFISIISFFLLRLFGFEVQIAIYRALSFLVISCPCAIAISVPLSYYTGIGISSKKGILIKGSDYLDNIRNINKIIFDKTGTITTGKFTDYKLNIINDNYKEKEIIEYYIKGETFSNHPIAKSIINNFNKKVKTNDVKNFKEISGKGIEYTINDKKVLIGSSKYVNKSTNDSLIYLKIDKEIVASLELNDGIKKESKKTIEQLKKMNIKTIMFTGDESNIANEVAKKIGIDEVKSELLPDDKYYLLKEEIINNKNGKVAFIGDGINDAPAIRLADIGISMGNVGSSSAIEASDIVIANDDLNGLIEAIKISNFTNKIIIEDLIFSLSTKLLVLVLCAVGIAGMPLAVFADTGVTLLAILNTSRILKMK